MGRPSKLSEHQWEDLLRRLASGEKAADLSRRYKVSPTSISKRVSQHAEISKSLAYSLAEVEVQIESLPVSQQRVIRTLADQRKAMEEDYTRAASDGVATAAKLHGLARSRAERLTEDCDPEEIRPIALLSETARSAASMATSMLSANKDRPQEPGGNVVVVTGVPRD